MIAAVLFAAAQPSEMDIAIAAADQVLGEGTGAPEANAGMQFVGFLFALASAVLVPIGLIAEGVRIGSRESRRDRTREMAGA